MNKFGERVDCQMAGCGITHGHDINITDCRVVYESQEARLVRALSDLVAHAAGMEVLLNLEETKTLASARAILAECDDGLIAKTR